MHTLDKIAKKLGWPAFRIRQIHRAREIELAENWDAITVLPKNDRAYLAENLPFDALRLERRDVAADGTAVKFLFSNIDPDLPGKFETVLLLHSGEQKKWGTVCISSQIGCPMKCAFCATGKMKFTRNLTTDEIVDQIIFAKREARNAGIIGNLNVVFMGMGEPLLNLDAVIPAIAIATDPDRIGFAKSRITVSTSGIPDGIEKLRKKFPEIGLALSLHAPTDELRQKIMPVARKFSLAEIFAALDPWEATGTEILHEYILIDGVNDSPADAEKLADLLADRRAKVNLIPCNPVAGTDFRRPPIEKMRKFLAVLENRSIRATLRHTKGDEIKAACGQLSADEY